MLRDGVDGAARGGVKAAAGPIELKLPATSANLGPGFDALGLAMGLYLQIEAGAARDAEHRIAASGRDAAMCGEVRDNLILSTYAEVLRAHGTGGVPALELAIRNEIPLGMGCGSSAAALLAGVYLADHFGGLGWTPQQILEEACRREGHPDNVAACFRGGMTASATTVRGDGVAETTTATFGADLEWQLFVALPTAGLATSKARALLPESYSRADAVANVQSVALLVSAFALDRPELLRAAMRDRIHQPYRSAACPLLPALLPLTGTSGIQGVALSGAGPSVLLIADAGAAAGEVERAVRSAAGALVADVIRTRISGGAEVYVTERVLG